MGLDAAQFVEFGVKAIGNHTAIADIDSRFGMQAVVQFIQHRLRWHQAGSDLCQNSFSIPCDDWQ